MSNKNVRSGSIKEVCRVLNRKSLPITPSLLLPWSPLCHQRSKSSSLNFVIEKIYQRIQGWRLKWCLRQLQAYNMLDQVSGYYCPQFMFTSSFNFLIRHVTTLMDCWEISSGGKGIKKKSCISKYWDYLCKPKC